MNSSPPKFDASSAKLRRMAPADIPALKEIYYSNVPDFVPDDREMLDASITEMAANYFVIEEHGKVVAGGGINLGPDGTDCFLYMGLVHRDHHRRGFGTILLLARLIWSEGDPARIRVMTHDKAFPFYQRFGFEPANVPSSLRAPKGFQIYGLGLTAGRRAELACRLAQIPIQNLLSQEQRPIEGLYRHEVNVTLPRPDHRVFQDLLYGGRTEVEIESDSIPLHSRDWTFLYLKDNGSSDPELNICADDDLRSFEVRSSSARMAEIAALYLHEHCGDAMHSLGHLRTQDELSQLAIHYHKELERARHSKWHRPAQR